MMLDRLRQSEQQPRSEYGGGNGRRMIGYDRNEPSPGRERSSPQTGGMPERDEGGRSRMGYSPEREGNRPPMGYSPEREWNQQPMGGIPGREWDRPPSRMPGPGWGYPPMGMYGGPEAYGRYEGRDGGMEMRRRRDRRGRYMMEGGAEMDEDDEDEKPRHKGGKMIAGAIWTEDGKKRHGDWKVDERKAMMWTERMQNPNGSTGPHFKLDIADQLRQAHCPGCDKWEFFVALNMMYADYAEVAKKFAADKPEFYVCMAKAFLEDPDAGEGKLAKYMEYIPE